MIFSKFFKKDANATRAASFPICACGHRASERLKNGNYWCPFCSKEFAGRKSEEATKTSGGYPCAICGQEFKSAPEAGKHFQKKHLKDFS